MSSQIKKYLDLPLGQGHEKSEWAPAQSGVRSLFSVTKFRLFVGGATSSLLCVGLLWLVSSSQSGLFHVESSEQAFWSEAHMPIDYSESELLSNHSTEIPILLSIQYGLKNAHNLASELAAPNSEAVVSVLEDIEDLTAILIGDINARFEQTDRIFQDVKGLEKQNAALNSELSLRSNQVTSLAPYKTKYLDAQARLTDAHQEVLALRSEARIMEARLKSVSEEYAKLQINFEEQLDSELEIYRHELQANRSFTLPASDFEEAVSPTEYAQQIAFLTNSLEIMRKDLVSVQHEHRITLAALESLRTDIPAKRVGGPDSHAADLETFNSTFKPETQINDQSGPVASPHILAQN